MSSFLWSYFNASICLPYYHCFVLKFLSSLVYAYYCFFTFHSLFFFAQFPFLYLESKYATTVRGKLTINRFDLYPLIGCTALSLKTNRGNAHGSKITHVQTAKGRSLLLLVIIHKLRVHLAEL